MLSFRQNSAAIVRVAPIPAVHSSRDHTQAWAYLFEGVQAFGPTRRLSHAVACLGGVRIFAKTRLARPTSARSLYNMSPQAPRFPDLRLQSASPSGLR